MRGKKAADSVEEAATGAPGARKGTDAAMEAAALKLPSPRVTSLEEARAAVCETLKASTGHDYSSYKSSTLLRRLERRMGVLGLTDPQRYLEILHTDPQEPHTLAGELLISVTGFLRDPEAFEAVQREVFPRLLGGRAPEEPVRIWHPGCATGEEAYSMAILVREYLESQGLSTKVVIFATDIDQAAIAHARTGLYDGEAVSPLGEERLESFFTRVNDRWKVAKSLREMVVFAQHSLVKDPPFSRLDLVVCRNILIYLDANAQKRVVTLFHQVLRPGAFLFLGAAETVGRTQDLFAPVDKKWKLYQRLDTHAHPGEPIPALRAGRPACHGRSNVSREAHPLPATAAEKILLERYAPPSVVVNDKYQVVHVSPGGNRYLHVPVGEPTQDLLKMAREELRPALRAAVFKAFADGRPAAFRGVGTGEDGNAVNLLVEPLQDTQEGAQLALVIFEPAPRQMAIPTQAESGATAADGDGCSALLMRQLEEQLRATHEQLRAVTEQLDSSQEGLLASNEELMSLNEEFQSANEELHATNEELETSKEELQALNEELVTVNQELHGKVEELNALNSDMENLLHSSLVATLFLDRAFVIKGFTPAMAALFKLVPADVGRPILRISGADALPVAEDASAVLETLQSREREVALANDRHFLMRVHPYRTVEGEVDGVVVTLVDITERKGMEDALRHAKEEWELTFDSVPDLIAILDDRHRIVRVNRAMAQRLGVTPEECVGLSCYSCVHGTDAPPPFCPHSHSLHDGLEHLAEVREESLGGDFLVSTTPLTGRDGRLIGSVHVARDISERKRAEEAHSRLAAIVESSADAIIAKDLKGNISSWNAAAQQLFGYTTEEVLGQPIHLLIPPELRGEEDGIQRRIAAGERVEHFETVRLSKEGTPVTVSVTVSPIMDRTGAIIGASKIARDITQRNKAEEALRQSEARFRTLADAIPTLCWAADADGWIFWYNQRWYDYTGTTPEQMEGWGWQSVHDPVVLPRVLERWRGCIASGKPFEMVFPLRGADGVFRSFLTRVVPLRDEEGNVTRWFGTNTDISEQRSTETALQRSNARLNLLAETAAELLVTASPQDVVEDICSKVLHYLGCHVFFNFLVNEEKQRLHLNACLGIPEEEARRIEVLEFGVAVCGCAARDACRIVAEDIMENPDPLTDLVRSYGVQSYACHPLMVQGRVLGTLSFGSRTRSRFSEDDLALMKAVADLVANAMERKRMEESLRRAHDELELRVRERTEELATAVETLLTEVAERQRAEKNLRRLNRLYAVYSEIDQAIIRAESPELLFQDFCRIAVENGGFLLAWVGLLDEGGRVQVRASSGATAYLDDIEVTATEEPRGEGPTGIAVREGTYHICNDFQHDPCTALWHERGSKHGIHSSAAVALKEEGRVVGAFTLYGAQKDFFDEQHVTLLRRMGADISFVLGNLLAERRRREAELALHEETLERLRAMEALREKEQLLIQQSRQAALGEMIGNIAHQWRQPLNVLGLMIQELWVCHETGELDALHLDNTVKKVMQVIFHMSNTIDDFRNFFRPDKVKVVFKARQAVEKVISILDGSLKEHRVTVEVQAQGDPTIQGFPNEYSQVLLNILLNARDAIGERKVKDPRIGVGLFEEEGRCVVTIDDNAGGIPVEIIHKIFDPYFTTKGPDKGTGVGLYMSKAIIEKNMNGRLTACNNDHGAHFRIEV